MNVVTLLTPTNLLEEKEKFFSDSSYHPQFNYVWDGEIVDTWLPKSSKYHQLHTALKAQNYSEIVKNASELFSVSTDLEHLSLAKEITKQCPEKILGQTIEATVTAFDSAFAFLGLDEYSIEVVDSHGFNFRPKPIQKKILMSKHASFDYFSIDGEVKHELSHIIRYENTKYNKIPFSRNYLPTEEGLATYCQDFSSENGQTSLFQHAAEYVVTQICLKGSLLDAITFLQEIGFSKELAWQRAVRHKFGWIDTSQPGDIMKPSMYFQYQQEVKKLTTDEKYRLFVGKIRIDELNNYPSYSGLISIDTLKEFYMFNF